MERKRRFPFGYEMREGRIVPNPEEAKAVVVIFQSFASGTTTPTIANSMTELQIPYRPRCAKWNKNMVCRILDNEKYIGANGYPILLQKELWDRVAAKRKQAPSVRLNPAIRSVRAKMCCAQCGQKLKRISYHTQGNVYWRCDRCAIQFPSVTDQALLDTILEKQNEMIQRPQKVIPTEAGNITYTMEIVRDMQILDHAISNPQTPTAELLQMAAQCVQNVYACCQEVPDAVESDAMVRMLQEVSPSNTLNIELLNQCVKRILMQPDGNLQFQVCNGTII